MSVHLDVWLREPSRAGLSPSAQKELLAQLAPTIERRARYFPDAPRAYLALEKDLLISAFLPQKGPLSIHQPPRNVFLVAALGNLRTLNSTCWTALVVLCTSYALLWLMSFV